MITRSKSGFTIVELLIVIVVIAILAAITTVAFNGIQQRARNAQIVAGVKTLQRDSPVFNRKRLIPARWLGLHRSRL